MKIREVLKFKEPDLPGDARSVADDRTVTTLAPVQAPNRIIRLGSQDVFPDADPNHGVTDDLSPALHPSPTSLARFPRHITGILISSKAKSPDCRGKLKQ
jgi:hypothetical protein